MATIDRTDIEFQNSISKCVICETPEEAFDMIASVIGEAALDFETTSLDPADGEVRLTSICNDDVHFLIDHHFLGPLSDYIPMMEGKTWWVYNSKFETRWLDYKAGHGRMVVNDVDFMAKAVIGGHPSSLAGMAKRDCAIVLDKSEQNSDWANPTLTSSQINYAGFDSHVTWLIKKYWQGRMEDGHWNGFNVFNDAVRATIEAERTGLILDSAYHYKLVRLWERKSRTFEKYVRRYTPPSIIKNLASNQQVGAFLKAELHEDLLKVWPKTEKTKAMQIEGAYLRQVAKKLPYPMNRWMAGLAGMRYYDKYLSTYGDTLITKQNMAGKVTTRFNIAQALTGRYSSSNSNLQNIPRKPVVRKSFYSPAQGTDVMCLADYKGIEVRVLAELSQDKQLLHDAIYEDVHVGSASAIYNLSVEEITAALKADEHGSHPHKDYRRFKEYRSRAKGFTFQLCLARDTGILTDRGVVPIQHVTTAMKVWDGVEWVSHGGAVCNGIKEVVTYDGITATPDHRVFCADGRVRPLADAMASGQTSFLSRTGSSASLLRDARSYSEYYAAERERGNYLLQMHSLRESFRQMAAQYLGWTIHNVLLSAQQAAPRRDFAYSDVAVLCHEGALQIIWNKLLLLRAAGHREQVRQLDRVYRAYSRVVSILDSGAVEDVASGQDRQRWALREGQHTLSLSNGKPAEQAEVWDLLNAGPRHRFTANGRLVSNTYGAGAGALSDVLRCSYDDAVAAITKWAGRYPKAYGYRDKMFDAMMATGYLPVCDGRTIYVWKSERSMPVAANYPIQGAAASVMYRAMYHVRKRFVSHGIDAVIAATVHDELLVYSHRDCAEAAMTQQLAGMRDGWLDIFPGTNTDNLVDHAIGMDWSAKP
jgi:DNA polymerase I-like protein with 3'-5' exonuclease and polymerase domains